MGRPYKDRIKSVVVRRAFLGILRLSYGTKCTLFKKNLFLRSFARKLTFQYLLDTVGAKPSSFGIWTSLGSFIFLSVLLSERRADQIALQLQDVPKIYQI